MKNSFILLLIAGGTFILQACSDTQGKNKKSIIPADQIPVQIVELKKTEALSAVHASGQFTTDDETNLAFKTGGVIEKIYVKEGDAVTKGQLLATLNLTEINAQVSQARLAFEKAERDYKRVNNLHRDSVATLEQLQNAKTGLDVAAQQYEAAKFNQTYSEIRALSNGFILRKMANQGQVIQSGTTVFQTNGARNGKWILKVGVSDSEWAAISENDKASVYCTAGKEKPFPAVVLRKSEGTDPFTGLFTIELLLKEKLPVSLASGMFGKAVITPSTSAKLWSIPYDALLDADSKSGYVFVTDDLKTARKAEVTLADINPEHVLVSSGLEDAKALIISGSAYLRHNSPIRIIENQ